MIRHLVFLWLTIFLYLPTIQGHKHENEPIKDFPYVKNEGQWHESVLFKLDIGSNALYFEKNALQYQFMDSPLHPSDGVSMQKKGMHTLRLEFLESNPNTIVRSENESDYYYNYFLGKDPQKWKSDVLSFQDIFYQDIYPGIDLHYYSSKGQPKYDFVLKEGADVNAIKIEIKGADQLEIEKGELKITHHFGEILEEKPYAYYVKDGIKKEVGCEFYWINENTLGFRLNGEYDKTQTLFIDPVIVFSTYSGYRSNNFGMTATNDQFLNGYMGGTIFGAGYNSSALIGYDSTFNGGSTDIAISKFSANGSRLVFSTFIGGSTDEVVSSMVANSNGELIIFGTTSSTDYPVSANAYKRNKTPSSGINLSGYGINFLSGVDIVLSKFSLDGRNLLGSTYYGGSGNDGINYDLNNASSFNSKLVYNYGDNFRGEVISGENDTIFIGTSTFSPALDTTNTSIKDLRQDGMVAKFSPDLDKLIWHRYIGGSEDDAVYSIKITDRNQILIGGGTRSYLNFPTTAGAFATTAFGGRSDGFISLIDQSGTILRSTYLGTLNYDQVYFVESDRFNQLYVLGQSNSPNYPILNSQIANPGAGQFIMQFDSTLSQLNFSHTFGDDRGTSNINISPTAFLVDFCQNLYVSGWGGSLTTIEGPKVLTDSMPVTSDAFSATTDNADFYFYVAHRDLDSLIYGSYIGGTNSDDHVDGGTSRFSKSGVIFQSICASCGSLNDFPTNNGRFPTELNTPTQCNNALLKFDFQILPNGYFLFDTTLQTFCLPPGDTLEITITNFSERANTIIWDFYGTQVSSTFSDTTIFFTAPGRYLIQQLLQDTVCNTSVPFSDFITIYPDDIALDPMPDTLVCFNDSLLLRSGGINANEYIWSRDPTFSNPFDTTSIPDLKIRLNPGIDTIYIKAGNTVTNACEKFDTLIVDFRQSGAQANIFSDTICEGNSVGVNATLNNIDKFVWDFGNGVKDSTNTSANPSYPMAGDYQILLEVTNNACNTKDSIYLNLQVINNNISLSPLEDTLVCRANSYLINQNASGTNIISYLWSSDPSFSDTLNNYPSESDLNVQQSGLNSFYVKVSNRYCNRIDSLEVEIVPFELDLAALPDSVCTPYSTQLNTTIIGADSFRIYFGDGNSTNSTPNPQINYTDPGTFPIQLIGYNDRCQIADTLTETIEVLKGVELSALSDTVLCLGEDLSLAILHNQSANRFIWSTDPGFSNPLNNLLDSTITIRPATATTYYYKGINAICEDDNSVFVDVDELEIDLTDFESICLEDTISLSANVLSNYPPFIYQWTPLSAIINGQNSSTITVSPTVSQNYQLIVTDLIQCSDTATTLVDVSIPRFTTAEILSDRDTVFKGESLQLNSSRTGQDLSYEWKPASIFNDPFSASPIGKFTEETEVELIIYDAQTGCELRVRKTIGIFEINCAPPDIFVPSAFTPNNDGQNDQLFVRGLVLDEIDFSVYNRWGEKVFETTDPNRGWDGRYKGKPADPGVFVYYLKAVCFDGQEYTEKGNVTLIR